jgi:hypothetical protein
VSRTETAVDLPVRWIVGIVSAAAVASFSVVLAGIALYERLVGPLSPAEAYRPPPATESTPVPFSPRSIP